MILKAKIMHKDVTMTPFPFYSHSPSPTPLPSPVPTYSQAYHIILFVLPPTNDQIHVFL